jgi:hypothetical protein
LDSTYSFYQSPLKPKADVVEGVGWKIFKSVFRLSAQPSGPLHEDKNRFEGRTHWAQGPNFGDGGIGYIFLKQGDGVPEGLFFWQCG